MKCEHHVQRPGGSGQCRKTAKPGFNLCHTHGWFHKYFIQFTWQDKAGDHWKAKEKAVWPMLFVSSHAAHNHLRNVDPFKNMTPRRKLTVSVEITKRVFPEAQLRKV